MVVLIRQQILITNLQGNVLQLVGRITNQILGVKGFDQQATLQLLFTAEMAFGSFCKSYYKQNTFV